MALTQKLEFRLSHALVITPQLMKAIKLLQLSNLDLAAYVEGELERNPLLEPPSDGEESGPPAFESEPGASPGEVAAPEWGVAAADHAHNKEAGAVADLDEG